MIVLEVVGVEAIVAGVILVEWMLVKEVEAILVVEIIVVGLLLRVIFLRALSVLLVGLRVRKF